MSITINVQSSGTLASVHVRGDLNGQNQGTLKTQMEPVLSNASINEVKLDFSGVNSIEPASTGMLMMLSHTAKAKKKTVGIVNARSPVLAQMHKANLGKIMPIG